MYRSLVAVPVLVLLMGLPAVPQQAEQPSAKTPSAIPAKAPSEASAVPVQPAPAAPQDQEAPPAKFSTSPTEVIVPVTVTDDKGKFVSNLVKSDFRILDEGRPQNITYFSHNSKQQAIVVGFLIDLSNSSRIHWKTYQDEILELVWNILPGDDTRYSGYLITYANDAEVAVNTTSDSDKIAEAVRRMKPGGGSAFYDAIYMACTNRSLVKGEPYEPRRVIIVVGDGHNNSGSKSLEEVLELAKRNMVTIYAISTQAFGFNNDTQDVLERITRETGGHVEYPLSSLYKDVSGYLSTPKDAGNYVYDPGTGGYAAEIAAGITKAIVGVSGDISSQYILRYRPDWGPTPRTKLFRRIKVEVPSLEGTGIQIRARDGYYPEGVPQGPAAQAPAAQVPVTGEAKAK
jgi:Ca-activated chloride channel family protein